jgi:hypothetical protein
LKSISANNPSTQDAIDEIIAGFHDRAFAGAGGSL